jgi:hypothetical protein
LIEREGKVEMKKVKVMAYILMILVGVIGLLGLIGLVIKMLEEGLWYWRRDLPQILATWLEIIMLLTGVSGIKRLKKCLVREKTPNTNSKLY